MGHFIRICITVFTAFSCLSGAVYYIDPQTGEIDNDGSAGSPWNTLEAAASSKTFSSGDTVKLLGGSHGTAAVGGTYDPELVITAEPGHIPVLDRLTLSGSGIIAEGMSVHPPALTMDTYPLISIGGDGNTVQNCSLYTVADISNWHIGHWNYYPCAGFSIGGRNNVIRNNLVKNIYHAMSVGYDADSTLVEYNTIMNFGGDGIRGLADYSTYQYNLIKNCYDVDDNHDDGFQSWSRDGGTVGAGVVYGVVLRGNFILNYEDPDQLLRGTLQGIGCFDGMFEGWLIENNVVMVNMWHGITLLGATDCVIINNTVGDLDPATPGPPWIQIGDHKDGRTSTGLIRNNLTTRISGLSSGVRQDNNITYTDYDTYFVDYAGHNFSLKEGCDAIDAGSDSLAPAIDQAGNPRPSGSGIDVGAYEYGYAGIGYLPGRPVRAFTPAVCANPFGTVLRIGLGSTVRSVRLTVCDVYGRTVASDTYRMTVSVGWTPPAGTPAGVYTVRLDGEYGGWYGAVLYRP